MSTVSSSVVTSASASASAWYDMGEYKLSDDFVKYRSEVRESFAEILNPLIFSPLNLTIVLAVLTLLYLRYRTSQTSSVPTLDPSRPITFATFTPRTLLKYNGHANPINPQGNVYIAVKGKVHDVTPGRNFYGPGGPYENFAGRDATRGLACQSFDEDMLTKDLDGPLDRCEDLDAEQLENLQGWVERFDDKYLVVGKLVAYNVNKSEF